MSESISQLTAATKANLSDIFPVTQGSIGPGSGVTRSVTLAQMLAPSQAASASATPSMMTLTRTGSTSTDLPVLAVSATYTNATGTDQPQISMTHNISTITAAEGQALWANLDEVIFNSATQSTASNSYVGRYTQGLVFQPLGGGATNPAIWANVSSVVDFTNQPSSVAGRLLTAEFDLEASGIDDFAHGAGRQIVVIVGWSGRNYVGTDTVITNALSITQGSPNISFKDTVLINGKFTHSLFNLQDSTPVAGAPTIIMGDDHTIAFDSNLTDMRLGWSSITHTLNFNWAGTDVLKIDTSGNVQSASFFQAADGVPFRSINQISAAGAVAGTLNNTPFGGNPAFWRREMINGTLYAIPCWLA